MHMYIGKKVKLLSTLFILILIFLVTIFRLFSYKETSNAETINPHEEIVEESNENEKDIKDYSSLDIEYDLEKSKRDDHDYSNNDILIADKEKELTEENEIQEKEKIIVGNDLSIEHEPEYSGSFIIINSVGYEKFTLNKSYANVYVNSLNYYADNLKDEVKIYNLLAPTSSEFNMPNEYRNLSGSQKDGIDYAYSNMNENIITVDAYSNLEKNKDDYLYFKTDHHWTALGAYRAYESFMKSKGEEAVPLDQYERVNSESKYLGSIYNMTENLRLENNLDDIWYYKPLMSVEYTAINRDDTKWSANQIVFPSYFERDIKYAAFMGGDTAFSHIKVESDTDKKILVIKDSYGNAFIPFLLPHYSDVFVADPRYFTENIFDVIKENNIDDVLIINYSTVLQLPAFSKMIGDMGVSEVTTGSAIKLEIN